MNKTNAANVAAFFLMKFEVLPRVEVHGTVLMERGNSPLFFYQTQEKRLLLR